MENNEEIKREKENNTVVKFTAIAGVIILILLAVLRLADYVVNKEPEHYFGDKAQYIENITATEQEELLSAFNLVIPDEEKKAYIRYFGKMTFSENYTVYFVEFDGTESFDAFYSVNPNRQLWVNQTAGVKEDTYLTYAIKVLGEEQENHKYYKLFEDYTSAR